MDILFKIGLVVLSFSFMEFVAWSSHKYIMHGVLWPVHKDHHQKDMNRFFEVNDFFFPIFAAPGILFIYLGYVYGFEMPWFWLGLGISLYGIAYSLVHDIIIHQRVKVLTRWDNVYVRAIRKAHKIHHKHLGKEDGENFGFLFVAGKYLEEARLQKEKYKQVV
jgi:beta-carotene 3-hydroxylase